jgi:hypothetical protein
MRKSLTITLGAHHKLVIMLKKKHTPDYSIIRWELISPNNVMDIYHTRSTLTDTRRSMSFTRQVELLLVKMNAGVLNDDAMLERLGVHGSAVQALDFDDLYEEVLLMDKKEFVAALQGAPANSDAHSDAHSIPEEAAAGSDGNDAAPVDWDE